MNEREEVQALAEEIRQRARKRGVRLSWGTCIRIAWGTVRKRQQQ